MKGIPIGDWDVSRVTNMDDMFYRCESFNEPLNNWNVSNVTSMDNMFYKCNSFNQPLDKWNVSNVLLDTAHLCEDFEEALLNLLQ